LVRAEGELEHQDVAGLLDPAQLGGSTPVASCAARSRASARRTLRPGSISARSYSSGLPERWISDERDHQQQAGLGRRAPQASEDRPVRHAPRRHEEHRRQARLGDEAHESPGEEQDRQREGRGRRRGEARPRRAATNPATTAVDRPYAGGRPDIIA
jgi:hypothetical protein